MVPTVKLALDSEANSPSKYKQVHNASVFITVLIKEEKSTMEDCEAAKVP